MAVVETDDMVGGVMDPMIPSLQPLNLKFSARQVQSMKVLLSTKYKGPPAPRSQGPVPVACC